MRVFIYIIQLLLLLLVYSVTGIYGLHINPVNNFATLVWLPTGISLAALLYAGPRLWPAVFLGAFIVNTTAGAPFFVAVGIATGNTLEALIAYVILNRFVHFQKSLEHLRDLLGLMFLASPIGSLISGTIGVSSLILGNSIPPSAFYATWSTWVVGDCLSAITLTPLLLICSKKISLRWPSPSRFIEGFLATVCLLFFCFFVFTDMFVTHQAAIGYLLFLPLVWIGLRFGQLATASAVVIITGFVFWGTLHNLGPFAHSHLETSINYIKTYIVTIALTGFSLSTVLTEKKILARRKDEFISIASHELKTPLTSISLLLHLLQKRFQRKNDTQSKQLMKKTTKQVKKMAGLIEDLLDISKIQMGKLVLRKEKFSIDPLIEEVIGSMQHITKTHKIIRKGQTRKTIVADKERIAQVLTNLINNAIKYSPRSNKIIVTIRTTKQQLLVDVTDFGIGIDKKNHKKIFERFFRISETDENLYPGFGVGLFIAAEIIEKHKGALAVKSTKGQGSTFSFTLPLI